MIGLVMMLVGALAMVAGFTGRWRALLAVVFPSFASRTATTAKSATAV